MNKKDVILVANSPGELSALVKPVAEQFKKKVPEVRLILILTPCQYASGKEVEFARKTLKVDEILSADNYKKWLLTNQLPFTLNGSGIVLFLGGDLMHAMLIAKKTNYQAYAYLAGRYIGWRSFFKKFFVAEAALFKNREKIEEVGDLMADSVVTLTKEQAREKWHIPSENPVLAFMPGSRKWEIDHMLPLYEKIGKILKKEIPALQLLLIISPFISMEDIETCAAHRLFEIFAPLDSITAADLVVTIPGTNTAQIAAAGLPMLVIFPLDNPEVIPLTGLLHYICCLPLLGSLIKRSLAFWVNKKTKFFALPNIKADRELVPEIRGKINPQEAARKIKDMLSNRSRLKDTSRELKAIMKSSGAAEKIVEEIINEALL